MKLTSLSAATVVLLAATLLNGAEASRKERQCAACYEVADHVSRRMQEAKGEENRPVSIGNVIGPNGDPEPREVIRYGDSDAYLDYALKGACDASKQSSECYEVLMNQEGRIGKWFHNARNDDFKKYVCDEGITGCSPSIMDAIMKGKMKAEKEMAEEAASQVEVEDDTRRAKKQGESINQQQQGQQKQAEKQAPVKAKTEQKKESTSSANDPMTIIYGFINRFKTNMLRVKGLSIDLYGDVSALVKAKQWNRLGALAKDPNFYKKYWYAFLWYAIGLYLTFSIFESLLAKPKPKPERRSGNKRKTTAATTAKRD